MRKVGRCVLGRQPTELGSRWKAHGGHHQGRPHPCRPVPSTSVASPHLSRVSRAESRLRKDSTSNPPSPEHIANVALEYIACAHDEVGICELLVFKNI